MLSLSLLLWLWVIHSPLSEPTGDFYAGCHSVKMFWKTLIQKKECWVVIWGRIPVLRKVCLLLVPFAWVWEWGRTRLKSQPPRTMSLPVFVFKFRDRVLWYSPGWLGTCHSASASRVPDYRHHYHTPPGFRGLQIELNILNLLSLGLYSAWRFQRIK